jgi:hypothetical protein
MDEMGIEMLYIFDESAYNWYGCYWRVIHTAFTLRALASTGTRLASTLIPDPNPGLDLNVYKDYRSIQSGTDYGTVDFSGPKSMGDGKYFDYWGHLVL